MALLERQPYKKSGRRTADRQQQADTVERFEQRAEPFAAGDRLSEGHQIFLLHVQSVDRPEQNAVGVEKVGLAGADRQQDTGGTRFIFVVFLT